MMSGQIQDLAVLVPGQDDRAVLETLITKRHASLNIRRIDVEFIVSPQRDPGCFHSAASLLDMFQNSCRHALVVFDYEGCGQEHKLKPHEVESSVKKSLAISGWTDRAEVVVIKPELEAWVWSLSPSVDDVLGWTGRSPSLRDWMKNKGLLTQDNNKPDRPKEAMEMALKTSGVRRSSANFRKLAEHVGLNKCSDPSFGRLRSILQAWFPS